MLKSVLFNVFVESVIHLFGLEIFCNNVKVFTVTFDYFDYVSLLNKSIKKLLV